MAFDAEKSVLIMGTGAMACLFAARLSAIGVMVWMSGTWPEGITALQHSGVSLIDAAGNETAYPVHVAKKPEDCQGARYSLVLVKSWQTERAARQLATCLANDGIALTLQNGLGNREILVEKLGEKRVCLGVTTIGANMPGPGRVIQAGAGVISVSEQSGMTSLTNLLRSAGFTVQMEQDPTALAWGKLVINAAINPITAILQVSNGELLERPQARLLLQAVVREAASVADAVAIQLPYPDPVAAVETIARRTAENRSSMLQDVLRGAPTEIDAICGSIIDAGERTGVPTPVNRTLFQLVKSLRTEER